MSGEMKLACKNILSRFNQCFVPSHYYHACCINYGYKKEIIFSRRYKRYNYYCKQNYLKFSPEHLLTTFG